MVLRRIKHILGLKKDDGKETIYIDTNVLINEGRIRARKLKNINRKGNSKIPREDKIKKSCLSELFNHSNLVTGIITKKEFTDNISKEEFISKKDALDIFEEIKTEFKIFVVIEMANVDPIFVENVLYLDIKTIDALHILTAAAIAIPCISLDSDITNEKNKKLYTNIYSVEEWLNKFKGM